MMPFRALSKVLAATSTVLVFLAPQADAATVQSLGILCGSAQMSPQGVPGYGKWGVHNNSTSNKLVVACGGQYIESAISKINVLVYDRHPSSNVYCDLRVTNTSGNELWSQTLLHTTGSSASVKKIVSSTEIDLSGFFYAQCEIPVLSSGNASHVLAVEAEF